ncbi:MAG: CRISPR-associated protein Cas4 [Anaerolineaceae bacterium]|nr:CRISPR-associated protein Cas4 [Anaerolineaceae bacterium]
MNRSEYTTDELLPLSGVQHFLFCRRQWALIHIEQQWQDNVLTVEGKLLHKRVDDPFFVEARSGVVTARAVPVASYRLGLVGVCDVVEFTAAAEGVKLPGRQGFYQPAPVEYKRGKPKRDPVDEVQLCAQAICLEEMLAAGIPTGWLYYGQTRHRHEVALTSELRALVEKISKEMHAYYQRGYTPRVKPSKACKNCSLTDICLPELQENIPPASQYISQQIKED